MWRALHRRRRTDVIAVVLFCLLSAIATSSAALPLFDPQLRFQRLQTAHFVIYFHQGEAGIAARLARIAEATWSDMGTRFGWTLPARTHVVLADQSDVSNGWATPLPYNTIVLTAAWPAGSESIGLTEDWIRLVFTHEFTHIAHLDRSRGWARLARRVFGRVPLAFPNLTLPGWQIEGIATYYESAVTGRGRMFANDFRAIEREPARHGRGMPLNRANGGLVAWPGGTATYSSGLGFHQYLAQQFGPDHLVALADRTAGRLPYVGSPAFRRVYGAPLGELWRGYQASLVASSAETPARGAPRRLTHEAFEVTGPRFLDPPCTSCPDELAYSVQTPHEFPALKAIATSGGAARTLTTRYLGSTFAADARTIVFDQREFARNAGLYSDLYALDRRTGAVRRITTGARLLDPDMTGGARIVAVRQARDRRDLVLLSLAADGTAGAIETLLSEPDTQFSAPRWGPDGTSLVVERHRIGDTSQVIMVDSITRDIQVIATGATRAVTPTWRPDGRAILAAVDTDDGPFNLVEFSFAGGRIRRRQLTQTTGGALWPDVSRDGRTLAFVGYTETGFDVFTQPYPREDDSTVPSTIEAGPVAEIHAAPEPAAAATAGSPAAPSQPPPTAAQYTPWSTLLPRAWMPLITADSDQTRAGFTSGGGDVLGYHAYGASILWRLAGPDSATDSLVRPDWNLAYVYNRWRPQIFASASRSTSYLQGASSDNDGVSTWRDRSLEVGMVLPFRRVLRSQRLLLAGRQSSNELTGATNDTFTRLALRSGWAYRSARLYGYSISPEQGVAAGASAEIAGARLSSVTEAATLTADARAYLPGLARHHVLALRVAGGASSGPRELGRTFRLGGGMPNAETLDFGRGAVSLLRGFPLDSFAGRRVAVINADYRFPLAWPERGRGTWPIFVRSVHGSVFADAGHAWNDRFRIAEIKTAAGVELSTDVVVGYAVPITLTAGVARGRDGAGRLPATTTGYIRVGRAF